jgi:hypothetical protein
MSTPKTIDALKGAEQCITKALPHLPPDTLAVHCGEWLADIREALEHPNIGLMMAAPDLLEALCTALPFVEDHEGSNVYKAGAVARAVREIRAAIEKATA